MFLLLFKIQQVSPSSSFVDDLGADSLDTVELVMALEEEFGKYIYTCKYGCTYSCLH